MHRLIVILGPTASGKSSLAIRLAKKFRGVVISADSRQVYRGLDIGTAKITKQEMSGVPHYLLDVASPRGQYSVSRYAHDVSRVLEKIPTSTPVFLVGGSPFYIKAVTEPGSFSMIPPNTKLRRRLEKKTMTQLITILKKQNPERAKIIDRSNRRRLIRAIEISSPSPLHPPPKFGRGKERSDRGWGRVLKIGLRLPRPELYRRIDRRVDARMRQGMLAEVARLHRQGLSWRRLEAFGLEYRYLSRYLRGVVTKQQAVDQLKGAIHDFTRRQLTWWRKEKDIHWVNTPAQAALRTRKFLTTSSAV